MKKLMVIAIILLQSACSTGVVKDKAFNNHVLKQEKWVQANPDDAVALVKLGNDYIDQYAKTKQAHLLDKALEHYTQFLALEPENQPVKFRIYQILFDKVKSGQRSYENEMRDFYEKHSVLKEALMTPPVYANEIRIMQRGSQQEIIEMHQTAIKQNPLYGYGYWRLFTIHKESGRPQLAQAILQQGLKVSPDVRLMKAVADYEYEQIDSKCRALEKDKYKDLIKQYQIVLKRGNHELSDREKINIKSRLHYMYWQIGLYPLAKKQTDDISKLIPKGTQYYEQVLYDQALNYRLLGQYDRALEYAFELRDLHPEINYRRDQDLNAVFEFIGLQYFDAGEYELAAQNLAKYLDNVKQSKRRFYPASRHFFALAHLKNIDIAQAELQKRISIDELNEWTQTLYDYLTGVKTQQQILDASENICQETEANYLIAHMHLLKNQQSEAIKYFKAVDQLDVNTYTEHYGAVQVLSRLNQ